MSELRSAFIGDGMREMRRLLAQKVGNNNRSAKIN